MASLRVSNFSIEHGDDTIGLVCKRYSLDPWVYSVDSRVIECKAYNTQPAITQIRVNLQEEFCLAKAFSRCDPETKNKICSFIFKADLYEIVEHLTSTINSQVTFIDLKRGSICFIRIINEGPEIFDLCSSIDIDDLEYPKRK